MGYLIMRRGPDQGKIYRLTKDQVTLGRGSKNDIVIHDNDVSREHLRLVRVEDGFELHDSKSSNGTFVNGQPVDDVWLLQSQCIIELGDAITIEYRPGEPQEDLDEIAASPASSHQSNPFLIVTTTSQTDPSVYPLDEIAITIGRAMTNAIVIFEPEMSREHLKLTLTGIGYTVEDMGSTNGTLLNGEILQDPVLLQDSDVIQIGTTVQMQFTYKPEDFISQIKTDNLKKTLKEHEETINSSRKRKTSPTELPDILADSLTDNNAVPSVVVRESLEDRMLITYDHEDWDTIVKPLSDSLEKAGIQVWVDQDLDQGSQEWRVVTEQARLECWLLLVIVSNMSLDSEVINRNWRHFHNREKPIILLMKEPVNRLPIGSNRLPHIHYNPALPQVAFQQIITEVNRAKTDLAR